MMHLHGGTLGEAMPIDDACEHLRGGGYWYLASPYTKYKGGKAAAYRAVLPIATRLIYKQVPIFCPVMQGHQAEQCRGESNRYMPRPVWLQLCVPMVQAARGIIIVQMDGWERSMGVTAELFAAQAMAKEVIFLWPRPAPEAVPL